MTLAARLDNLEVTLEHLLMDVFMTEGRRCQVHLLDDRKLELLVQPKLLAKELLDLVASHFNLKEKEYFGIAFTDETGLHMDKRTSARALRRRRWVRAAKELHRQAGHTGPSVPASCEEQMSAAEPIFLERSQGAPVRGLWGAKAKSGRAVGPCPERGHLNWLQLDRRVLEHDFPKKSGPVVLYFCVRMQTDPKPQLRGGAALRGLSPLLHTHTHTAAPGERGLPFGPASPLPSPRSPQRNSSPLRGCRSDFTPGTLLGPDFQALFTATHLHRLSPWAPLLPDSLRSRCFCGWRHPLCSPEPETCGFYIESISYLKDNATIELFFLNAKSCIYKELIDVDSEVVFELASYILQEAKGDFSSNEVVRSDLKKLPALPTQALKEHPSLAYWSHIVVWDPQSGLHCWGVVEILLSALAGLLAQEDDGPAFLVSLLASLQNQCDCTQHRARHGALCGQDSLDEENEKRDLSVYLGCLLLTTSDCSFLFLGEDRVIEHYKKLNGQTRGQAIVNYMSIVESLPTYGVHYYAVKDKQGIPWWLGLSYKGIFQYDYHDKVKPRKIFQWRQLENLYFREKKFSVEVHDPRRASVTRRTFGHSGIAVHTWYACAALIKSIWAMAISQHQFYLDRKQSKSKIHAARSLSEIAIDLTETGTLKTSKLANMGSKGKIISGSSGSLLSSGSQESDSSQSAKKDMLAALKSRQEALEETLRQRLEELKRLCLREAELTGKLPVEYPLDPGEEPPIVRRRIGTAFKLDEQKILPKGEEAELERLEREFAIQSQITEAARRLASDPNVSKKLKKQRKTSYLNALKKLQEIENAINENRIKSGKKPTQRASLVIDDGNIASEDSSLSDALVLEDEDSQVTSTMSPLQSPHKGLPPRPAPPQSLEGLRQMHFHRSDYDKSPIKPRMWSESSLDEPYEKAKKRSSHGPSRSYGDSCFLDSSLYPEPADVQWYGQEKAKPGTLV
ncbi:FERM domain-containing protein 4A [Fukomys damarensis]|uniref:FERM domain-containing protein 4A n=1 Tax=Fukomys damarensis TaxID=885580 RepID=A0A091D5Y6_FUKDA|nr:FERM domain-containing protein 4A [Fukomys damarensis]